MLLLSSLEEVSQERGLGKVIISIFFVFIPVAFIFRTLYSKYLRRKRTIKKIRNPFISKKHPEYPKYLQKITSLKEEANRFLAENKLQNAYDKYTEAIDLNVESNLNAILYSNRAFTDIKLENFGLALEDANNAIDCDPRYIKGYYRRACANLFLMKYKDALKDFEDLIKKFPEEEELKKKISKARAQLKKQKFDSLISEEESNSNIENDDSKFKINLSFIEEAIKNTVIETSYRGPTLPEISSLTQKWVKEKIIEKMKSNIFIHKKYLLTLIKLVTEFYSKKPSMIDISINNNEKFNICGDIHGQFYDFLNIFELNGYPSEANPYLFAGDFVDRGPFSVEVVIVLLLFKVLYPNHLHLQRGNHENRNLNKIYGFENEVKAKYDAQVYEAFIELFHSLPLSHCINKKILAVHGGLFSKDGVLLDDIRKIERFREIPEEGIMCELLWSDPSRISGRTPSKRGVGINFGQDVTERFLKENGLDLLVRSHEVKQEGYEVDGKVITVFSAPNYCDQMGNKGALMQIKGNDLTPKFLQFDAVPHPNIPSMAFAGQWMFL